MNKKDLFTRSLIIIFIISILFFLLTKVIIIIKQSTYANIDKKTENLILEKKDFRKLRKNLQNIRISVQSMINLKPKNLINIKSFHLSEITSSKYFPNIILKAQTSILVVKKY